MFTLPFLSPPPPVGERRRAPRFKCGPLPATVNANSTAQLVNISRAGALIQTSALPPLHDPVTLWVELPDRVVEFRGRVVRYGKPAERRSLRVLRHQVGIEFLPPSSPALRRVPAGE